MMDLGLSLGPLGLGHTIWIITSILCDRHLDLILRDGLYYLCGDAYVNLIKQIVNVIGYERSKIEINLKVYVEP